LILAVFSLTGCSGELRDRLFGPAWTWPRLETSSEMTVQTTSAGPNSKPTVTQGYTRATTAARTTTSAEDRTLDFSEPTPDFDDQITSLLLEGLDNLERSIILDAAFTYWVVRENQVQEAIDRIYDLYTDVYLNHPRFFYLNGSFQVYYSVLRGGDSEVAGLRIEPAYWSSTDNLDDEELHAMTQAVDAAVSALADQIRAETNRPREQLILIHDWLIGHIAYDPTGDQGNNHAGSALLQQVTLCQGYAQSFQLIGQELGIDVQIVTGTSDGIGHAWNQVILDGIAYHVDVTHDDPTPDGGADHPVRHVHLFRSDAVFSLTHQWDAAQFLPCPDDGAFYYRDRGLVVKDQTELRKAIEQFLKQIDLGVDRTWQLELLYNGLDRPDKATLDTMLSTALQKAMTAKTVYYRADLEKDIVIIQVSNSR
ncbi:MAG: transglutaminase domain-containing protein, partial [Bacillota bacterium]|nr:transglutaminase domain-containing protein [Bacillota bacterium]